MTKKHKTLGERLNDPEVRTKIRERWIQHLPKARQEYYRKKWLSDEEKFGNWWDDVPANELDKWR